MVGRPAFSASVSATFGAMIYFDCKMGVGLGGAVGMDVKIIIEQHPDGFVAYPAGLRGVVVGEGDTREGALADVTSAIRFHVETFGPTNAPEKR
jgi:predicted RNase H-like HicB family nuclease